MVAVQRHPNPLSIPPWSDFFGRDVNELIELGIPFNPTLVWFLLDWMDYWEVKGDSVLLSIPPWSDFFTSSAHQWRCPGTLSIPPWSDFFSSIYDLSIKTSPIFQSHLGLISSNEKKVIIKRVFAFQSHLGLISSASCTATADSYRPLSIPPWSDFFAENDTTNINWTEIFQSHLGLISSRNRNHEQDVCDSPFNPTLVWFLLMRGWCYGAEWVCFQSHLGLISSRAPQGA